MDTKFLYFIGTYYKVINYKVSLLNTFHHEEDKNIIHVPRESFLIYEAKHNRPNP